MAELQYGKEANHIKKAEAEARQWKDKKAAQKAKREKFNTSRDASTANAQKLKYPRKMGADHGQQISAHRTTSIPVVDPTLHPSWVAKQTEKAAIAAALSAAKSKKIVFDDSD